MGENRVLGRFRVTPARRFAFFVSLDVALVVLATLAATLLRYDAQPPEDWYKTSLVLGVLTGGLVVLALAVMGVYRASWLFFGLRDFLRLNLSLITAALAAFVAVQFWQYDPPAALAAWSAPPRSVPLIAGVLSIGLVGGFRLSKRALGVLRAPRVATGIPTLIVGAGPAGVQVLESIRATSTRSPYRVIGFVDDDPLSLGTAIEGVRVLGRVSELESHVAARGIKAVIISVPSASGAFVREVLTRARQAGVDTVRIVPPVSQLVDGTVSVQSTREVSLEDLLGREMIRIEEGDVRALLAGKRVLVTGGAGTIGAELCRQIAKFEPARLVILDVDESRLHDVAHEVRERAAGADVREALIDVRSAIALTELFAEHQFHVVFHAAAYKHVPMMEKWPLAGLEVNVLGTSNVVEAAEAAGVQRFILISTDKAVDPSSVMGATKRLAEKVVFAESKRMIRSAVRFGNVIGSRGSVIPTFERQLKNGGPLTVTHPAVERFFMMTSEAVSLVLQAAALGRGGDVFVLDMGKPVRILDVAREFIRMNGLEPDVDIPIVFTGLRPGEKLQEILSYPEERLTPTIHPRILRAIAKPSERRDILETVRAIVDARDGGEAVRFLRETFPTLVGASGPSEPGFISLAPKGPRIAEKSEN